MMTVVDHYNPWLIPRRRLATVTHPHEGAHIRIRGTGAPHAIVLRGPTGSGRLGIPADQRLPGSLHFPHRGNNDILFRALYYREKLLLLLLGNLELVLNFFEVGPHRLPFLLGDVEMLMGLLHPPAGVLPRSAGRLADHGRDVVLEIRLGDPVTGFLDFRVGVQDVVDVEDLQELVDDRGNVIYPAKPLIEGLLGFYLGKRGTRVHKVHEKHGRQEDSEP